MKPQVIFVQGAGEGAYDADQLLVSSLASALGSAYDVLYPRMPNEDAPDYERWKPTLHDCVADDNEPVVLVGHSLGGYVLLKYLTEGVLPDRSIIGIFVIAAPFPSGDKNWIFDGFSLPTNFGAELPASAATFTYHSRDDLIVPFAHMALYASAIPNATMRETFGGHQLDNDLSVVAADIHRLREQLESDSTG